jgi:glutathione S-transferase
MFTIYGRANSSNVRKVLWLCAEIGQEDYERLDYGRDHKPCSSPEYMALNPNKVVPTLVDSDVVLWESNTQLRYLTKKFGRDDFYPSDLVASAKVDMWLDWQLSTSLVGLRVLFQGLQVKDPAFTDPTGLEKALAQANHTYGGILNDHMAKGSKYIAGNNLTIADCSLGMYVHRWFVLPIERPDAPALAEYYERLKERGPFQKWIVGQGV